MKIALAVDIVSAMGAGRGCANKTVDITVVATVGSGRGVIPQKACESCHGFWI
ncbi:MAG TPA: hypothetical protein VF290_16825 [Pyrinomonadaceae bacterium]